MSSEARGATLASKMDVVSIGAASSISVIFALEAVVIVVMVVVVVAVVIIIVTAVVIVVIGLVSDASDVVGTCCRCNQFSLLKSHTLRYSICRIYKYICKIYLTLLNDLIY